MPDLVPVSPSLPEAHTSAGVIARMAEFLRLNVSQGDASENTIRAYLIHVGQFVEWCRATGVDPGHATEAHLARYRRYLVETGLQRSTVGVKLAALRRFFQASVWHGLRPDNPAEGLKPPRDHTTRRDKILARYLTREEVDALLDVPEVETPAGLRDRAMMGLMYYHGLRVSEVARLELHDLRAGDPWQLHVIAGKGNKSRVVLLTDKSLEMLEVWIDHGRREIESSSNRVFLSLSNRSLGEPLTPAGVRWIVKQHLKRIDVYREGMGPHALRHAHASHALAAGADLNALASEMGHASIETTTVYTHIVDAVSQNPAEFL